MFLLLAFAQEAAQSPQQPSFFQSLLPMLLIFAVLYFLILRPQAKRAKAHAETLKALKRGDEVLTAGGIYGKIDGLSEEFATLEVDDGVKIKVLRRQIASTLKGATK
jgi:preprotein translocase subunit YajC